MSTLLRFVNRHYTPIVVGLFVWAMYLDHNPWMFMVIDAIRGWVA